jgi:hypothetical protein
MRTLFLLKTQRRDEISQCSLHRQGRHEEGELIYGGDEGGGARFSGDGPREEK